MDYEYFRHLVIFKLLPDLRAGNLPQKHKGTNRNLLSAEIITTMMICEPKFAPKAQRQKRISSISENHHHHNNLRAKNWP